MDLLIVWISMVFTTVADTRRHDRLVDPVTVHPLDMAPDSVDDDYKGCSAEMSKLVDTEYLPLEKCGTFKEAWEKAEEDITKMQPLLGQLTMNHAIAIRVYSNCRPKIFVSFNEAVRISKKKYKTTFGYHALHFLLTDAIQRLNPEGECLQVYRGTVVKFKRPKLKLLFKSMRFGSFTSTSVYSNNATWFGTKTCFEVLTCHGANVSKYSQYPDENEVLIPPYEKFTIKKIIKNPKNYAAMGCDKVYQLKSSVIYKSNLRCALIKKASGVL